MRLIRLKYYNKKERLLNDTKVIFSLSLMVSQCIAIQNFAMFYFEF
jgi:hypothetical protein